MELHKHNFSPAMHGWGVFPNNERYSMQKKEIFVKLIYSIKTNLITSFFSKFLVKFLRSSIKYVDSREVSGALKVALLRSMTSKAHSKMIPGNEGKNEFAAMKLMG